MDLMVNIDNSKVHHGKHNNRAYIAKFSDRDDQDTIKKVENLAMMHKYDKIIAKVSSSNSHHFENLGYLEEASFPTDNGLEYVYMSKFMNVKRADCQERDEINTVVNKALEYRQEEEETVEPIPFVIKLGKNHVPEMIEIYKKVFATYPFPIHDEDFLKESMDSHTFYYGLFSGTSLAALSSAEICSETMTVEMTDFATLPEHRGKGYASALLRAMEMDLKGSEIKTFYTIARAVSYGMNITFAKAGYGFGGTLINNTNISGNIESMNIWFKDND